MGRNYITVDWKSNEIVILDIDDKTQLVHCFAKDSEHFMDIILHYADYNSEELMGTRFGDEERKILIDEGVKLADGNRYETFIKMLLQ